MQRSVNSSVAEWLAFNDVRKKYKLGTWSDIGTPHKTPLGIDQRHA